MPGSTVCVVDDDPSVRRAVSRLLGSVKLSVRTYSSAEEFLDAAEGNGIACLILDVHLDGMTGLDLYERLTEAGSSAPPVIFITAHDDDVTRERIRRCDAIAYIRKPFESTALLAAVSHAVGRDLDSPAA